MAYQEKEHTEQQERKAEHLAEGLRKQGESKKDAEKEAWRLVDEEKGKQGRGKTRDVTGDEEPGGKTAAELGHEDD